MIIYADRPGDLSKALYTDNEDHTIHYTASVSNDQKTIVFISIVTASMPTFRLTYTMIDKNNISLMFEMAPPGRPDAFNIYFQGKAHRK